MRKANYDKFPSTKYEGWMVKGWDAIVSAVREASVGVAAIDLYTGVFEDEVMAEFAPSYSRVINTRELMKSEAEVRKMTDPFMTDDVLFGYVTNLRIADFFDMEKVEAARAEMAEGTLVFGIGASFVCPDASVTVYADMARWEIQQRFRKGLVKGLGIDNSKDPVSI